MIKVKFNMVILDNLKHSYPPSYIIEVPESELTPLKNAVVHGAWVNFNTTWINLRYVASIEILNG